MSYRHNFLVFHVFLHYNIAEAVLTRATKGSYSNEHELHVDGSSLPIHPLTEETCHF